MPTKTGLVAGSGDVFVAAAGSRGGTLADGLGGYGLQQWQLCCTTLLQCVCMCVCMPARLHRCLTATVHSHIPANYERASLHTPRPLDTVYTLATIWTEAPDLGRQRVACV